MRASLSLPFVLQLAACQTMSPPKVPAEPDVHSHARPAEVQVTHVDLDLRLDFAARRIAGTARLDFLRRDPSAPLVLDTRDLSILAVTDAAGAPRAWRLGVADPVLGTPLVIELAPGDRSVVVRYATDPGAAALQWLAPDQTADGRAPYLYTQGQAILTRSWVPLQDSPGVRITFAARIEAPDGLTAVMAAEQLPRDADGAFRFRMPQPVPPYLLALACGELEFRALSPRCGVWAEPGVVGNAAEELEDLPAMLASCERLFGPYRWGRCDVLILPPAFPFGGMENPSLTFATPTILAGDKSLVALIAHELAHSWSGNLVTNATWSDFWLNEGFTVYLEQRVMEEVFGEQRAQMEILIGLQGLADELATLPAGDQCLHVDLRGRNPDDGMTQVPYDKGAAFLRMLEQRFGRPRFDAFLAGYFSSHAFQSITTAQFEDWLQRHLLARDPEAARGIDLDLWIRGPGLPDDAPRPSADVFSRVDAAVAAWRKGAPAKELGAGDWNTQEWLHFLAALEKPSAQRMAELDAAYGLTARRNSEIVAAWLKLAIEQRYEAADAALEEFLLRVGRRKFLKPLYEALVAADPARAKDIYARARSHYHAVSQRTLDGIVNGAKG